MLQNADQGYGRGLDRGFSRLSCCTRSSCKSDVAKVGIEECSNYVPEARNLPPLRTRCFSAPFYPKSGLMAVVVVELDFGLPSSEQSHVAID